MSSLIRGLQKKKLISPPKWLPDNVMYLCQMGSVAYGVATEYSDVDVYGFAIRDAIRSLLFECLEMHYDLSDTIIEDTKSQNKLDEIRRILDK